MTFADVSKEVCTDNLRACLWSLRLTILARSRGDEPRWMQKFQGNLLRTYNRKPSKMESSMEHRRVGWSGLKVSAIGVRCNPFGIEVDASTAGRIVDTALDLGVTYFDTADSYSQGVSEEIVGQALAGKRDKAVIGTKFGNRMGPEANDKGTSRKHIMKACEASLARLRTDYIDLYQVHDPDRDTPIEETMRALDDLVRQGKVRYVGCSNFFEWEACEAQWTAEKHGLNPFISCQDF